MNSTVKSRIALISLGCPKNLVDSEVMLGLLAQAGYPIVEDVTDADIAIVNTCAFIEPAQEEAIDALLDMAELKADGQLKAVICTGCLPQRYGSSLVSELPEVDSWVQIGSEPDIVNIIRQTETGLGSFVEAATGYELTSDMPRWRSAPEWLAYIRIAEGCDHRCSFCTIPAIRGRYRSRRSADLRSEIVQVWSGGAKEAILIAQDTTAWGHELPQRPNLASLLRELGPLNQGGWSRVLYTYPQGISDELLEAMAAYPGMVPYLDVPLQHASPSVLKRMGRPGTPEAYLNMLERARTILPDIAVRTTFILGFPGETDEDFELLLDFVTEARLDRVSAFAYSPEEGTPAATMPEQVDVRLALDRFEELMRTQEPIAHSRNMEFIGRKMRILVERKAEDRNVWFGRSYRDAPEIDCEVKVTMPGEGPEPEIGEFCDVVITSAEIHDLNGELLT